MDFYKNTLYNFRHLIPASTYVIVIYKDNVIFQWHKSYLTSTIPEYLNYPVAKIDVEDNNLIITLSEKEGSKNEAYS